MRKASWGGLECVVAGGSDGQGGGQGPIVVLLHGFGAPGDDLVALARAYRAPPEVRFVFPAGRLDLGDGYMDDSRAWWMIDLDRLQRDIVAGRPRQLSETPPEGLAEARERVVAMLDQATSELGASAPLVLGGFSQGAMLACDVALRSTRPLAGLLFMSGNFLTPKEWTALLPARKDVPILMSHGRADPLLLFAHAELLHDAWRAAGANVEWLPFEGGHEIPQPVLDAGARLIRKVAG